MENLKEFTRNGVTLEFYNKPGDEKYSFRIKGDEELTARLLASVSTKRVKEKDIEYAVNGIFDKIKNNQLVNINSNNMNVETNPIVALSELVQKTFGESLTTEVLGKTGPDHNPTVSVKINLPNGKIYKASGGNQRIAKQLAAQLALDEWED